jgi:hypothetical protein
MMNCVMNDQVFVPKDRNKCSSDSNESPFQRNKTPFPPDLKKAFRTFNKKKSEKNYRHLITRFLFWSKFGNMTETHHITNPNSKLFPIFREILKRADISVAAEAKAFRKVVELLKAPNAFFDHHPSNFVEIFSTFREICLQSGVTKALLMKRSDCDTEHLRKILKGYLKDKFNKPAIRRIQEFCEAEAEFMLELEVFMEREKEGNGGNKEESYMEQWVNEHYRPLRPKCTMCKKEIEDEKPWRCARCQVAIYCSPKCQKENWSKHKKVCKKPNQRQ